MNTQKMYGVKEEIQYRLDCLKNKNVDNYNIVLYGTGINAKRILDLFGNKILGLADREHTGEFLYGKKVLSEEEILLLGIDLIILAAEPDSAEIIYKRIYNFCLTNKIQIWDMYGNNMFEMRRQNIKKSLEYGNMTYNSLKEDGKKAEVIFISFEGCLFEQIYEEEDIINEIDKELNNTNQEIINFVSRRKQAKKRIPRGMNENIEDIYTIMGADFEYERERLEKAKSIEKQKILESFNPRQQMIEIVKFWRGEGKRVIICSHLFAGKEIVKELLEIQKIFVDEILCLNNRNYTNYILRYIHGICDVYGRKKILFVNSLHDNPNIANIYNIKNRIIKSTEQIYKEYCSSWSGNNAIDDKSLLQNAIGTPFVNEINKDRFLKTIGMQLLDMSFQGDNAKLDIINICQEYEKIEFETVNKPLVSIIIPAYNQFSYTYCCLKSIKKNSKGIDYEIILVDDCSNDETSNIEQIISGLRVIHNKNNLLFLKNCNMASELARGDYLVFLNNDTQVQPGWLRALLDLAEKKQDCGIVGSKLIFPNGALQEAGGIIWNDGTGCNYGRGNDPDMPDYNYVRETDYISGASIMISKELWNQIGGFDELFAPAYYEDADLAFEVRKRGKKVYYQPKSVVIHFEGISNGKDVTKGVKKNQLLNHEKFISKWKQELLTEHMPHNKNILAASERKMNRKTILVISVSIPRYDRDAGSRTIDFYIQEFLERGYIVKFIPHDFAEIEPYTSRMRQMGVEVFAGEYYKKNMIAWLYKNYEDIDYVFANYPNCTLAYLDIFKNLHIPIRYYGMDLHYHRFYREYEISGDISKEKMAKEYYEKEQYLIKNCDVVYYPSQLEVDIVKKQFEKIDVRTLNVNIYKNQDIVNTYDASKREGIMFVGSYYHSPNVDAVKWFVSEIFSKVNKNLDIIFYVVGSNMPTEIINMASDRIKTVGYVTDEELKDLYQKIKMVVVPLRYGAGIKGKVIEAMFYGVPVLSTSIGMEGIPRVNSADLIADDAEKFRITLERLYSDNMILNKISKEETEIIRNNYSQDIAWNNISQDF